MKRCLLTAKTDKLIRETMMKNNDSIVTFLRNVLNRNCQQTIDREVFKERVKNLKKKINDNEIVNKTIDRDAFKKRAN